MSLCDLCVNSFSSFPHRLSQLSSHSLQFLPRLRRPHSQLQHHQRHPHIVSRRPQSVLPRVSAQIVALPARTASSRSPQFPPPRHSASISLPANPARRSATNPPPLPPPS